MFSPRTILITALVMLAVVTVFAACSSSSARSKNQPTPTAEQVIRDPLNPTNCRFFPGWQVEVNGNTYVPLWGPMRSDILRTAAFRETDLEAVDTRECTGPLPENIYEIAGVPIEQVFVEVRDTKNMNGANSTFPIACNFVNEVYTFTAVGAEESPPPFSRPTPEPWTEARPSPTPPPSPPTNGPLVELSEEGLLAAGWPYLELTAPDGRAVYWDSGMRVLYRGHEYRFSASGTLNDRNGRFQMPLDEMDQVGIIFVHYLENRWPEGLAKSMPHLLTDGKVDDRVKVLRVRNRPIEEVIVIDPCPTYPDNLQPNNVVFWGRVFPPPPNE